jgi:glycyl-tRNA synthetase (class II)
VLRELRPAERHDYDDHPHVTLSTQMLIIDRQCDEMRMMEMSRVKREMAYEERMFPEIPENTPASAAPGRSEEE